MVKTLIVLAFLFVLSEQIFAQGQTKPPPSVGWTCQINAKPVSMPPPKYPESALVVGVTGKVDVEIVINKTGKVILAKALTGHPFLRSVSEKAALSSKFEPVLIGGKPRRVSGVITYNFIR